MTFDGSFTFSVAGCNCTFSKVWFCPVRVPQSLQSQGSSVPLSKVDGVFGNDAPPGLANFMTSAFVYNIIQFVQLLIETCQAASKNRWTDKLTQLQRTGCLTPPGKRWTIEFVKFHGKKKIIFGFEEKRNLYWGKLIKKAEFSEEKTENWNEGSWVTS